MIIKLNLDYKKYNNKPESSEVPAIRKRLAKATTEIDTEDFIEAVERGQTFTPAAMTGTTSDTWQSQQIIVADIDNDGATLLDPKQARVVALKHDIDPFCIYKSFSYKDTHPKYRMVVILDRPITDANEARDLTERFTDIFNNFRENCADTKICDNARLIFGSRQGCVIHRGEVTPLDIMRKLPARTRQNASQSESMYDIVNEAASTTQRSTERQTVSNNRFDLLEPLYYIDPDQDYDTWTKCGMALEAEGYTVQDWISWSRKGLKFKEGECENKWKGFRKKSGGVTGAFITDTAKKFGYIPPKDRVKTAPAVTRENIPEPTDQDAPPAKVKTPEPAQAVTPPEPPKPEPTPLEALEQFYNEIQSNRFEPITTGIEQLDKALQGGLERRTLVTLAAAPGAGKTAIAQYILENMAKNGHPVIYVNLEMDRAQLLSRSISRISHQMKQHRILSEDVTALEVKRGYNWTESQKAVIDYCLKYYAGVIAPNFYYVTTNPENIGSITNGLSDILHKLEKITDELKKQGKRAPLVCIDYLQFIDYDLWRYEDGQRKPDNADAIKQTLAALKNFAMSHDTVVMVITANNRASNAEGRASMDSGRDTSNIEYSGDVMLSLVYTAVEEGWYHKSGQKDKYDNDKPKVIDNEFINRCIDWSNKMTEEAIKKGDEDALRFDNYPKIAKHLSLKVVKGRSIQSRGVAKFVYEGKWYYYEPDDGKFHNPYWTEDVQEPE